MASRLIAYLTPLFFDESSYLGGGERYPLNLARGVHLATKGDYRIDLISFGREEKRFQIAEGVDLHVLPVAHTPRRELDVVSWALPAALAKADVVHIHQAYTRCAEMGLLVAKQLRKPVCITDHGGETSRLGIEIGHLELVDRVIAYSDFGASLYKTTRPIEVIKGGVDAELFQPPKIRPRRDRVLFVGRLLPHKGIDMLINAMPPDILLTVCGRPYNPKFFEKLKKLAIGKKVEFVTDGDDKRIKDLYARAWATVLPSVYRDSDGNTHTAPELMGFTLLESMACGTPAIASRVGAMPEFIRHGETGFVFDSFDEIPLILRSLIHDPMLVRQMGERGRNVVLEEYDLRVAGRRMADVYAKLLAEPWRQAA